MAKKLVLDFSDKVRTAPHVEEAQEVREFRERLERRNQTPWENWNLPKLPARAKPKALQGTTMIVMGDAHAHPDTDNHRFVWASNLAAERRPDVFVDMGDSADMASLFMADAGRSRKLDYERRRYYEDVECYLDSRVRLTKKIPKSTRKIKLVGNHENRINRFIDYDPNFAGIVDMTDLRDVAFGWELHPFLEPVNIEGILFSHYTRKPASRDAPLVSVFVTKASIDKYPGSVHRIVGHSHKLQWYETHSGLTERLTSLMAGCYFDPLDTAHDWSHREDRSAWRAGLLWLRIHKRQILDFEWLSIERLEREYS